MTVMLRNVFLTCLVAALAACASGDPDPQAEKASPAASAAPVVETSGSDIEAPDPAKLKLKKSKAKAIARVIIEGDVKGRDGTFKVVGRKVPYGGCIERDVSHEDSLLIAPRELFGLAENPKLDDDESALASVQVVTLMPDDNGTFYDMPVSFSARYGADDGGTDDFIAFTGMAGFSPLGQGAATVERKGRRVNVTIIGSGAEGMQVRAAFSCRLPKK